MHTSKLIITLGLLIVSSCASTPDVPVIAHGAQSVNFTHTQETFRQGLNTVGSSNIDRPPAIIEVIYSIECLSGSSPSAQDKFFQAQGILKESYVEAPVLYNNPRERGSWRRNATRKIFDETSCVVKELEFGKVNTNKVEVMLWAITNGVISK